MSEVSLEKSLFGKQYNTLKEAWYTTLQIHAVKIAEEKNFVEQCSQTHTKIPLQYLAALDKYIINDIPQLCANAQKYCWFEELIGLEKAHKELVGLYARHVSIRSLEVH